MRALLPSGRNCALTSRFARQSGQSATEFLIVFPVLIFLTLGAIQWALIYQARATLNYATFLAARAGALNNGNRTPMRTALAAGLSPLFAKDATPTDLLAARAKALAEILVPGVALFVIVNPTTQAFTDFAKPRLDAPTSTDLAIPNDSLNYRNVNPGAMSGMNIQDANLLHLRVNYCYRMIVPVVGRMIEAVANAGPFSHSTKAHGMSDPFGIGNSPIVTTCGLPGINGPRLRLQSEAVVRLQSPFFRSNL